MGKPRSKKGEPGPGVSLVPDLPGRGRLPHVQRGELPLRLTRPWCPAQRNKPAPTMKQDPLVGRPVGHRSDRFPKLGKLLGPTQWSHPSNTFQEIQVTANFLLGSGRSDPSQEGALFPPTPAPPKPRTQEAPPAILTRTMDEWTECSSKR